MSDEDLLKSARDDLAFMRGIVRPSPAAQIVTGESFVAAGLIYGGQCVFHLAQVLGWAPQEGLAALAITIGFTVAFGLAMAWIVGKNNPRIAAAGGGQGGTARMGGVVFGAIGMTNLVLLVTIGIAAIRAESLTVWLLYPAVVVALQGSGWLAFFMLRKEAWMLLVAGGNYACAIAMSVLSSGLGFVLVIGFALLVIMTGSGLMLIRQARREI